MLLELQKLLLVVVKLLELLQLALLLQGELSLVLLKVATHRPLVALPGRPARPVAAACDSQRKTLAQRHRPVLGDFVRETRHNPHQQP